MSEHPPGNNQEPNLPLPGTAEYALNFAVTLYEGMTEAALQQLADTPGAAPDFAGRALAVHYSELPPDDFRKVFPAFQHGKITPELRAIIAKGKVVMSTGEWVEISQEQEAQQKPRERRPGLVRRLGQFLTGRNPES